MAITGYEFEKCQNINFEKLSEYRGGFSFLFKEVGKAVGFKTSSFSISVINILEKNKNEENQRKMRKRGVGNKNKNISKIIKIK